jgi:hypothetical protein
MRCDGMGWGVAGHSRVDTGARVGKGLTAWRGVAYGAGAMSRRYARSSWISECVAQMRVFGPRGMGGSLCVLVRT